MNAYERVKCFSLSKDLERLVLLGIASFAQEPGMAAFTTEELAKFCYLKPELTEKLLDALERTGELFRQCQWDEKTKQQLHLCFVVTCVRPAILYQVLQSYFRYDAREAAALTKSCFASQANYRASRAEELAKVKEGELMPLFPCTDEDLHNIKPVDKQRLDLQLQQLLSQASTPLTVAVNA